MVRGAFRVGGAFLSGSFVATSCRPSPPQPLALRSSFLLPPLQAEIERGHVIFPVTFYSDTTADFTRTLNRRADALLRDTGYALHEGAAEEATAAYAYDPAGRLASVTGAASQTFAYNYTEGRPALIDTVAGPVHTVANTWETPRNALDIKQNQLNSAGANDPSVSLFDYTVNNIGQRTRLRTLGSAFASAPADWDWSYDTLGQLTHATHQSVAARNRAYTYDTIGNRTKAANSLTLPTTPNYTANALNQYSATPQPTTPVHDADGNLTDDGHARMVSPHQDLSDHHEVRAISKGLSPWRGALGGGSNSMG